jgi:hypothetical protein
VDRQERTMSGRVTPPGGEPSPTVSSLRTRSPLMWWVAIIVVVALIFSTVAGAVAILFA